MAIARRLLAGLLIVGAMIVCGLIWTATRPARLDLGELPGRSTGRSLVALGDEPARCRAALDRAGVRYTRLPARIDGPHCGYRDALHLEPGGALAVTLAPADPPLACSVVAALAAWQWSIVQPAARRYLGAPVIGIDHLGSYNCRHIAGSASWSEHSTANALDVAAFRFPDGRRISVADDWRGNGPEAAFLHHVRAGACRAFATVLSPDYNAAHHDHLHLDQAARGAWGGQVCR